MSKKSLKDTGERMVPEYHAGRLLYAEHLTRYLGAKKLTKEKVVLDIACGTGYGSQLISKNAKKVYGVDIDVETIDYAKTNFNAENIEYLVGDGEKIPLPDNSVDVVVTFETIEHIADYAKFVDEIKRVLKPDGLVAVSTPNDLEFAEGNHFHVHEFEYDELVAVLKKDFKYVDSYYQATWKYVAIGPEELISQENLSRIEVMNLAPLPKNKYLYFFLVCSNRHISESIEPIGAAGEHYSDKEIIANAVKTDKLVSQQQSLLVSLREQNKYLQSELDAIISSKTFKLATSAAKVKRIVTGSHVKGRKPKN